MQNHFFFSNTNTTDIDAHAIVFFKNVSFVRNTSGELLHIIMYIVKVMNIIYKVCNKINPDTRLVIYL